MYSSMWFCLSTKQLIKNRTIFCNYKMEQYQSSSILTIAIYSVPDILSDYEFLNYIPNRTFLCTLCIYNFNCMWKHHWCTCYMSCIIFYILNNNNNVLYTRLFFKKYLILYLLKNTIVGAWFWVCHLFIDFLTWSIHFLSLRTVTLYI
jgi:hypothetical protein